MTTKPLLIRVGYDPSPENPAEWDGWKPYSFNRHHYNFNPDLWPPNIGLRRKLQVGTAFTLSYFEHGLCRWSLGGEGWNDPWDSVSLAGLLLWEHNPRTLHPDYEKRKCDARGFIETYTNWCNGSVYQVTIEERKLCGTCDHEHGAFLDSLSGLYGEDDIKDYLNSVLPDYGVTVEDCLVVGEAKYILT